MNKRALIFGGKIYVVKRKKINEAEDMEALKKFPEGGGNRERRWR